MLFFTKFAVLHINAGLQHILFGITFVYELKTDAKGMQPKSYPAVQRAEILFDNKQQKTIINYGKNYWYRLRNN